MARFTPSDQSVADAVKDPANAGAVEEATRPAAGEAIAERLAERFGSLARASAVFAEPVVREGITVIPVARARVGFGGGSGADADHGSGEGGGGAAMVTPVGWIEITDSGSRFRRLVSRERRIGTLLFGLVLFGGVLMGARERAQARRRTRWTLRR